MSEEEEIRDKYCAKYGHFQPRKHDCIRQIEALHPICLKCKEIWMEESRMAECADNLIEVQNAMKQELRDEAEGASRYKQLASILGGMGENDYSKIFTLLAQAEDMHKVVLESLVDAIDLRCGEEPSSKHIPTHLQPPSMRRGKSSLPTH